VSEDEEFHPELAGAARDGADVIAPPPVLLAAAIAAGYALKWIAPLPFAVPGGVAGVIGIACLAAAVGLGASALGLFLLRGENPPPHTPTKAVIEVGPYRFTRNPMYLGMVLILVGLAFFGRNLWMVLIAAPFAFVIHTYVILREEAYLTRKFGPVYEAYCARVRRWI